MTWHPFYASPELMLDYFIPDLNDYLFVAWVLVPGARFEAKILNWWDGKWWDGDDEEKLVVMWMELPPTPVDFASLAEGKRVARRAIERKKLRDLEIGT